jgi:hypothetical protein
MPVQLHLIEDSEPEWRIPEVTREIGRRGLAEARAVLRRIPRRDVEDDHQRPAAA